MTAYAAQVAAVPGPVLPLLACAALACVWLWWRAWHDTPPTRPAAAERPRLRLVRAPYDWEREDERDGAA